MRQRLSQLLTLSGLTALETVRQPICLLLMLTCLVFLGILPIVLTHTLGEPTKLIRDSALALHLVTGLLLGGFAASSSVNHEIQRGTAAAVLTKPVGREVFFLSKFLGIAGVTVLFSYAVTLASLLTVRTASPTYILDWWSAAALLGALALAPALAGILNFWLRKPFTSTAFWSLLGFLSAAFLAVNFIGPDGAGTAFGENLSWPLASVHSLVGLAILVLVAIAVSLATRLDTVATLSLTSAVLLAGFMSDYFLGRHVDTAPIARFLYTVIPNWQHFWAADALTLETPVSFAYLVDAGAYGLWYMAATLCLGMAAFRHMELRS